MSISKSTPDGIISINKIFSKIKSNLLINHGINNLIRLHLKLSIERCRLVFNINVIKVNLSFVSIDDKLMLRQENINFMIAMAGLRGCIGAFGDVNGDGLSDFGFIIAHDSIIILFINTIWHIFKHSIFYINFQTAESFVIHFLAFFQGILFIYDFAIFINIVLITRYLNIHVDFLR